MSICFFVARVVFVRYGSETYPIHRSELLSTLRHQFISRPASRPRLVACAQVRDMKNAAQVWVAFHILQGFDKFIFYDDGSEPPLHASDFGALSDWVTVKRWHTYQPGAPPSNMSQQHTVRQWHAFTDCLNTEIGNNSHVAVFDVDEYFWSCDPSVHFADAVMSFGDVAELHMSRCPRFGGVTAFDPTVPVISQLTRRAPGLVGEPVTAVRVSNPDCDTLHSVDEPRGICYSATAEKSIFDMRKYSSELHKFFTIHGLRTKNGIKPPVQAIEASELRNRGLCCNHYIVRDDAEAAWKAVANHNDFYRHYLNSEGVRAFYHWKEDTVLRDAWAAPLVDLLQSAGLPFNSESKYKV